MKKATWQPSVRGYAASLVERITPKEDDEAVIKGFKPSIPDALPDGTIPADAFTNGLVIHAPIFVSDTHNTHKGNEFDLIVDNVVVPGTTVVYSDATENHVVLRMPAAFGEALSDGFHDVAYRDSPKPWGEKGRSEPTQILIDHTPAGARRLPRIEFPLSVQREGLSLATLLSLPEGKLPGSIPGYEGFKPTDILDICVRLRGEKEILLLSTPVSDKGSDAIELSFDLPSLSLPGANGVIEFYYYVKDKAGNKSDASSITPISVYLIGAPENLGAPVLVSKAAHFVSEHDIKPDLQIFVPEMTPPAMPGDIFVLYIDKEPFRAFRIIEPALPNTPAGSVLIGYDEVWNLIVGGSEGPLQKAVSYTHFRDGIPSRSGIESVVFDLTVPGGRDPQPSTPDNEALRLPLLRGASGGLDNHISFADAELDANVHIETLSPRSRPSAELRNGDVVTVTIDGEEVGEPYLIDDDHSEVSILIPSKQIKAHPGSVPMRYSVARALSTTPHISIATSPVQLVRIDSRDGLPGAGGDLRGALFPDAVRFEEKHKEYAVDESMLGKGFTPIRVYGYANMAPGDLIKFEYTGWDNFDGGSEVPAASGFFTHIVDPKDLDLKDDDLADPPEMAVFLDIHMDRSITRTLAFGRFESSYTVTNGVGSATAVSRAVKVSDRGPAINP